MCRSYGRALLHLGQPGPAARQWERRARLDPAVNRNSDVMLALAYWADGQREEAVRIFNAAVARQPERWAGRDSAPASAADWTETEKTILLELQDARRRLYSAPADSSASQDP